MKKPKKLKSDVLMEDEDDKTIKAENEKNKAKLEELQNIIDAEIESKVKKLEFMTEYLSSRFALKKGQYPHLMKF
ncbi:hypothetical protein MHBO_003315 [Bonamia ostreae]|uniref:Uncharacterized protein n=1 Tax=Bonamia ostreae TaxID=126728 RepID=A0ABV2AQZ8_9EUKA